MFDEIQHLAKNDTSIVVCYNIAREREREREVKSLSNKLCFVLSAFT